MTECQKPRSSVDKHCLMTCACTDVFEPYVLSLFRHLNTSDQCKAASAVSSPIKPHRLAPISEWCYMARDHYFSTGGYSASK